MEAQRSADWWKALQKLLFWITSDPTTEANLMTWEQNLLYSGQNERHYSTRVDSFSSCGTLCCGEISFFNVLALILPPVISPWQHFGPITEYTIKISDF